MKQLLMNHIDQPYLNKRDKLLIKQDRIIPAVVAEWLKLSVAQIQLAAEDPCSNPAWGTYMVQFVWPLILIID